jgi:hypothetical protein
MAPHVVVDADRICPRAHDWTFPPFFELTIHLNEDGLIEGPLTGSYAPDELIRAIELCWSNRRSSVWLADQKYALIWSGAMLRRYGPFIVFKSAKLSNGVPHLRDGITSIYMGRQLHRAATRLNTLAQIRESKKQS